MRLVKWLPSGSPSYNKAQNPKIPMWKVRTRGGASLRSQVREEGERPRRDSGLRSGKKGTPPGDVEGEPGERRVSTPSYLWSHTRLPVESKVSCRDWLAPSGPTMTKSIEDSHVFSKDSYRTGTTDMHFVLNCH